MYGAGSLFRLPDCGSCMYAVILPLAINPHESLPAVSLIELRINKSIIDFIYLINIQNY